MNIIADKNLKLFLDKDPFAEKSSGRYKLVLSAGGGSGYVIPSSFAIDEGDEVLTNTFIEAIKSAGLAGLRKISEVFTRETQARFRQINIDYNIKVYIPDNSNLKIDVDGKENLVSDRSIYISLESKQIENPKVTWRTNEGTIKTGTIKEINNPEALRFKINISQIDAD